MIKALGSVVKSLDLLFGLKKTNGAKSKTAIINLKRVNAAGVRVPTSFCEAKNEPEIKMVAVMT
jgi:hypothetical protein